MTAIILKSLLPVTWVLIISILAFFSLGWLEVKRNQRFLILRLVALLMAVFIIFCLITNPHLSVKKSSAIIVLTDGYSKQIADSLLKANPKSQVYALQNVTGFNAVEIKNYRDLIDLKGNLFVLGEGVPSYMLEYMDTSSLRYFPATHPQGFISINSTKIYTVNQRAELNGIVNFNGSYLLTLTGPGSKEDSVRITTQQSQPFSLEFIPIAFGLYLYTLTASDSLGEIRYREQVPVQVREPSTLSILVLSGYPSAEVRFLKTLLEKKGHKLTLRYKISMDKYRTEFINTPEKKIGTLNRDLLQTFDLVLTDGSFLTSLSVPELHTIKQAIQDGLGVLTLINTYILPKKLNDVLDVNVVRIKRDSAQLLVNNQRLKIPAAPLNVSSNKKLFAIQREAAGRIVSGYYRSGLGKSGFQLLTNTFSLALAGKTEAYAEIWSPLLEAVARKEKVKYDLSIMTSFPYYPDEPVEFAIIAGAEKPTVKLDSLQIPLVEDPLIKNVWLGKFWAGKSGWNVLAIDQDSSTYNFFVPQQDGWKSLQKNNQQKSMMRISSPTGRATENITFQPVPKIFFYLLFLLSVGFLWLAPKI